MVQEGWRADEQEVRRIAEEVLRILEYLGQRRPAVTHRWGAPRRKTCPLYGNMETVTLPLVWCGHGKVSRALWTLEHPC